MDQSIFVLIHSPLVGPLTWSLVADELRQRGCEVIVPELVDDDREGTPFWRQHVDSVVRAVQALQTTQPVVLVAHSGAGALLPTIGRELRGAVAGYCFVDAVIPVDGMSRLDLLETESAEFARGFHLHLTAGGRFPEWTDDDLASILPDPAIRSQLVGELQPRTLPFFSEPIPVFAGWPDAPCGYLQLTENYDTYARRARDAGWGFRTLKGGHFHMLVDPVAVAEVLIELVRGSDDRGGAAQPTSSGF